MNEHTHADTLFGTDGMRSLVGTGPFTLHDLAHVGQCLSVWACQQYGPEPRILIAYDTRISCQFIKCALLSGLLLSQAIIHDAGVLPTPAAHLLLSTGSFDCAIIISASHNPYQDNGLKIIDSQTHKLSPADEQFITALYHADKNDISYEHFGTLIDYRQASQDYINKILALFTNTSLQGLTIALDCAHGATSHIAPLIFEQLGARVITIANQPDGKNINHLCGALHTQSLQKAVVDSGADIGFAFDGDGDRLIVINRHGCVKNGDDILALLLDHPAYAKSETIVGTVMSNQGLDEFLRARAISFIRAPVGDKYVLNEMMAHQALVGGEQSGHIILHDYLPSSDGIVTALRIIEAMQISGNKVLESFEKYPQVLINVSVNYKKDLDDSPLAECIGYYRQQLHKGRILVRYSGTENVLRVMVEDDDFQHSSFLAKQLATTLQQHLT